MVSDAGGQAAATAAMDQSAFAHMEKILRDETKGEYVVGKMLGRGGMAVVYLAEETRLGRKVALKVLPPELTFGHGVDRFLREAKTAATLDHPNIIPIYRIASGGKLFWYAMKFLEGRSLEDVLRERGTFTVEETIEILEQVADALDYAHDHQVIHRDIKPANVMLDSRDRVIITDFGIAKALSEGALTASGSVIGTPYFMSPEQGMGKPVAGAADQYSVAVMAFRMLAGHIPFDGDSAIDILHKHCMMEPPRLEDSNPELPPHVCDAVDKALSKKAPDRFPNIRSFVKALKDPNFKAPRQSASTVVLTADEIKKATSGPVQKYSGKAAAAAAAAKSAAITAANAADKTVVASPAPSAKPGAPRPSAAPEPKSKMPIFAGIGLVIVAAGGYFAFLGGKGGDTEPTPTEAPTAIATAAPTQSAPTVTPPVDSVVTPPPAPEPTPTTKAPTPTKSAPTQTRPAATPTPTKVAQSAPTQSAPAQSAPVPSAPAPAPSAPAATTGVLRLLISGPAILSIDGQDKGEAARFQGALSPGQHEVKAVSRDGTMSARKIITIVAGETKVDTLTLVKP
jgi:serine/threonine-protein kinase